MKQNEPRLVTKINYVYHQIEIVTKDPLIQQINALFEISTENEPNNYYIHEILDRIFRFIYYPLHTELYGSYVVALPNRRFLSFTRFQT